MIAIDLIACDDTMESSDSPQARRALQALSPEARAAAEAAIPRSAVRRATPEGQAEQQEVIRKVREEIPPRAIDPELASALSPLRAERERQGLSLSDLSQRSGIDRATLSRLETGKVSNPTVGTLRAVARAQRAVVMVALR
ncbi:MAG: helix-turn-helix transcriptional regulator [Planctomycetaceae bacterium]|nr:helix-turn-helix transcriptional regulator [Planctomycetaceae bacterium]